MPIDAVVKIGGSLLHDPAMYGSAVRAVGEAAARHALAIVPGGGPFADVVRELDDSLSLGNDVAHWLAIRAMDAHAELLSRVLPDAILAEAPDGIVRALAACRIPVIAPFRWLRQRDPLPHSWDVTSDSIAAWVAGQLGAPTLVLVKPVSGDLGALADAYFARALPIQVRACVMSVDELASGRLSRELGAMVAKR